MKLRQFSVHNYTQPPEGEERIPGVLFPRVDYEFVANGMEAAKIRGQGGLFVPSQDNHSYQQIYTIAPVGDADVVRGSIGLPKGVWSAFGDEHLVGLAYMLARPANADEGMSLLKVRDMLKTGFEISAQTGQGLSYGADAIQVAREETQMKR